MFYNKILEKIILPVGDFLLGQQFIQELKNQRKEVYFSTEYICSVQEKKLIDVLNHATQYSKYYRSLKISQNDNPVLFLKQFPILNKQILKEQQDNLITVSKKKLLRQSSSGSSGIQSVVYWTKREQSKHRATQILWWEWAGYKLGMPMVQTGMTPNRGIIKSVKDCLLKTFYFPAFVSEKNEFEKALHWAASKKIVFLGGYASSLYVLSKIYKELDVKVKFCSAVSWGDKLYKHYQSSIEDIFDIKVKETYGSAEGLMIAAQKDLPYMYIMAPNVFLEILDDEGNEVKDGEIGHVVVTSLVAKAMPLIRYKIGDLAIKLPKDEYPENCELKLPLLKKVIGRDTDLVKTRSGKFLVVHTFTGIFEHFSEIEQFCVIQENLDSIIIEFIPSSGFNICILDKIKILINQYLKDSSFIINFKEVKYIAPTPSGKPQIIISKLQQ